MTKQKEINYEQATVTMQEQAIDALLKQEQVFIPEWMKEATKER